MMVKPTGYIRYVDPNSSGGDGTTTALSGANAAYASLNACLAALKTALSSSTAGTTDGVLVLCRRNGAAEDTTAITSSATWTTTSEAKPIWIEADTDYLAGAAWSASAYTVHPSSGSVISLGSSFVVLRGIQVKLTDATATARDAISIAGQATGASSIFVDGCFVQGDVASNTSTGNCTGIRVNDADAVATIRNCVVVGIKNNTSYGYGIARALGTVTVENCTVVGCGNIGVYASSDSTCKNTYSGGNRASDYSTYWTFTTCASSDATVRTGVTASIAYSADNFVSVTAGSEDLHLAAGASATLKTGGTDLSSEGWTTDIDGDTRVEWGVGADEYIVADVTAPTVTAATIDAAGTSVTVTTDEAVTAGAGGNAGMTLTASGGAATLTYSSGSGSTSLVYAINRAIQSGEICTLDYAQPGNGWGDAAGNDLASFSARAVTNNSTQGETPAAAPSSLCTLGVG